MIDCLFLAEYFLISCICFEDNIIYNNERKRDTHTQISINKHINFDCLLIPIEC